MADNMGPKPEKKGFGHPAGYEIDIGKINIAHSPIKHDEKTR
jgi:hypothetical protein